MRICDCLARQPVYALPDAQPSTWQGRFVSTISHGVQQVATWAKSFFQAQKEVPSLPARWAQEARHPVRVAQALSSPQFDPTMVRLQGFITNLAVLIGNSLYTHFIQPAVASLESSSNTLSPSVANTLQTLSETLASACANEIASCFDNALGSIDTRAKALLTWLLYEHDPEGTKDTLFNTLKSAFSVPDDFLHTFINSITDRNWLSGVTALSVQAPPNSDSGFLQSLLVKVLETLISDALQAVVLEVLSIIDSADLQQSIQTNATIIGTQIGTQFTTLIQTTAPVSPPAKTLTLYQQGYDRIIELLYKQIEAVVTTGGDLTKFIQQDTCDPAVHQMLSPPVGADPASYQSQVEQAVSLHFAEQFVPLLLPDQRSAANGLVLSIPGIILLIRSLQLPANIVQAIKDFLKLPDHLFPNGPPENIQELFSSAVYFLEKGLASILNDQIQNGLGIGLNLGMNMVVPPIYLTMWMVKGAFPALFPALTKAFLMIHLQSPGDATQKAFLPLTDPTCNRQAVFATLIPYLQGIVQDMCKEVPLQSVGVTSEVFATQITPLLNDIANYFVSQANGKAPSHSDCKMWLKTFAKPADVGSNTTYGKLLMDLMFHMGNLKALNNKKLSELICGTFLQGIMSKTLTSAMDPLRSSEELIVGGIVNGLSNIMSTQAEVDSLLFGEPTPPVDMSAQLDTQLNQISWFVYRIITTLIDQMPDSSNWFTKYFKDDGAKGLKGLLPEQPDIKKAFTSVYSGVLGNRTLNENLYLQVVQVILKALQDANRVLEVQS